MNDFLGTRNMQAILLDWKEVELCHWLIPQGLHIRSGPSTIDGGEHAVVYAGDRMVHDPTIPRSGIAKTSWIYLIVPLDPACVSVPYLPR